MPQDLLEQLRAIDPAMLTEIVRQSQHSSTFELAEWSVERLSAKGIINPDGLFRFSGTGRTGSAPAPWSLVLKVVRKPEEEQNPRDIWYWKRELLVAQSQLLDRLPGPLVAPRIYAANDHTDSGWLWMEHIVGHTDQRWSQAQYAFAARELGRFNGTCLSSPPIEDYPWLCTEHCRWWLKTVEQFHTEQTWDNPFVRAAFSQMLRARVEQLLAEKDQFLAALNHAPQVFSHFDCQRRNLFIRRREDSSDELVAVDWAFAGRAALGGELFALIGSSALLFEVEADDLPGLEPVVYEAYLAGLRETGWNDDPQLVRLAYTAWRALWLGAAGPALVVAWTPDEGDEFIRQQFGRSMEAIANGWARLCKWGLDGADEARLLMDQLHLR